MSTYFFALATLALLLQTVVPGANAQDLVANLTVTVGNKVAIRFRSLFPNELPGMLVNIKSTPFYGTLTKLDGSPIVGANTLGNEFLFTPRADALDDGVANATEALQFYIQNTDETQKSGVVNILVKQWTPTVAMERTYRSVLGRTRVVTLVVRGAGGRTKLNMQSGKLSAVKITKLPQKGCVLQQFDDTPITDVGSVVTDNDLRVKMTPPAGGLPEGQRCTLKFVAIGLKGTSSNEGTIYLQQSSSTLPRAYSTTATFRLGVDTSRSIELIGSTTNPDPTLQFDLLTMPSVGKLYNLTGTTDAATEPIASAPAFLYRSTRQRIVLTYMVTAAEVKDPTQPVVLQFKVTTTYGTSAIGKVTISFASRRSPVCGDVVITPVFWDHATKNVILNYSDPSGFSIQRLVLLSAPQDPIGDLQYSKTSLINGVKTTRQKKLQIGDYFSDSRKRLTYVVRKENAPRKGNQTYTFRAQNYRGDSCVGSLTLEVLRHDRQNKQGDAWVRRELVRLNDITLLPLWGKANKTQTGEPVMVVIRKPPSIGSAYTVTADAPFEGRMYRNRRADQLQYCRRHQCSKYLDQKFEVGTEVRPVELASRVDTSSTGSRLLFFYKSEPGTLSPNLVDTIEYVFRNAAGEESDLQRIVISFKKAKKRVIEVRYKAADITRWTNFNHQQELLIRCRISNSTQQAVLVPPFDYFRRHNKKVDFRLFQYRREGERMAKGDRVDGNPKSTTRDGVSGQWLQYENTLLLVPGARNRDQSFSFRAVIYNLTSDNHLMPETAETVRVRVIRDNHVPVWLYNQMSTYLEVYAGDDPLSIRLKAYDADGDLLSFRIADAPKRGVLKEQRFRFGTSTARVIKKGSRIRIPKGSKLRDEVTVSYQTHGDPRWEYPVQDFFSVYADDGGGVLSEKLFVNITILGDKVQHASAGVVMVVNTSGIAAALAIVCVLCGTLIIVLRRRSRQRYLTVPQSEMAEVR
jgi:hypothetical protein